MFCEIRSELIFIGGLQQMKQPDDAAGAKRKSLPTRRAIKGKKPAVLDKPGQRKRILKKGSDEELIKAFGEK